MNLLSLLISEDDQERLGRFLLRTPLGRPLIWMVDRIARIALWLERRKT